MADLFDRVLQRVSWRGIEFYFSELTTSFEHDMGEHKPPDRDGALLEATGRGPRKVTGKCIFRNQGLSLLPKRYQKPWFPDVFREFEKACADRSTGTLVHPVRGSMQCKVVSFSDTLSATSRDGVDVDVSWKEHTEYDEEQPTASPLATALAAAELLDPALRALQIKLSRLPVPRSFSFVDAMRQVQAASDRVALIQRQAFGRIDSVVANARRMIDAIERTGDLSFSLAKTQAHRIMAACIDLRLALADKKPVSNYVVARAMTVADAIRITNSSMSDFIKLNRSLFGLSTLRRGIVVRYYR